MTIIMLIVAFFCGAVYGYSMCQRHHDDHDDSGPNYYRSGQV